MTDPLQRPVDPAHQRCPDGGGDHPASTVGDNAVQVAVVDGPLWITQPDAGALYNECVDPVTDRVLSALPISDDTHVIAIRDTDVFTSTTEGIVTTLIPAA